MAGDLVQIRKVHKLGDGLVQEDEVAIVVVVRVLILLLAEPLDGILGYAGLAWKAILFAPVRRGVKCVDAEDLCMAGMIHDGDPRSEVAEFFLVRSINVRRIGVHIPEVTRPGEAHTVAVVDLVKLLVRSVLHW